MKKRTLQAAVLLLVLWGAGRAAAEVSFELQYSVGGFGIGRQSFDQPVDAVEDREENVYVVDQGNNRVQVLDRRGTFLREWGGRGFTPGLFDRPAAIAIDPVTGNLFVVDRLNNRVQKFDRNGKFLMAIGRLGSGDGDFNRPMDVALDKNGNIYVADPGNNRIEKFDPTGKFLLEWGKYARRRRGVELTKPASLAYSEEGFGYLYVLATPECIVQKFDIDGALVKTWPIRRKGEDAPCGASRIRIEPRRYTVYISDTENNRLILFDKEGELLGEFRGDKVPLKNPGGLFVNVSFGENVVVADTGNHLVQKFRRIR
ncbi:MAG: NHL repeat containing protein [Actinobacteria bacterium]|nr:NHL repeat containing protein [Actinomycetota bacterium]